VIPRSSPWPTAFTSTVLARSKFQASACPPIAVTKTTLNIKLTNSYRFENDRFEKPSFSGINVWASKGTHDMNSYSFGTSRSRQSWKKTQQACLINGIM